MPTNRELYDSLASAAEKILSHRLGAPIRFSAIDCLSDDRRRNLLLRCKIENESAQTIPASVIIKQVRVGDSDAGTGEYEPEDLTSWDTKRFMSDWIGAEFLSSVSTAAGHSPLFYGGDREQGFIVLEDLGSEHGSLVEPLLEGDAQRAETALLAFADRLGQMHADTVDEMETYQKMTHALHPDLFSAQKNADELRANAAQLQEKLEKLAITIAPAFEQEVQAVIETVLKPGPFLSYIHLDPCPDNIIYQNGTLRLIDFEFGRMGHALLDITYGRMIMPTCWCCSQIPPQLVAAMEAAHRSHLATVRPQVEADQVYDGAMAHVCGFWLANTINWLLPRAEKEDSEWGIATVRPRIVARLEAFISTAEKADLLPGYRATANRLHAELSKRWPDMEPLPLYPAFIPSGARN